MYAAAARLAKQPSHRGSEPATLNRAPERVLQSGSVVFLELQSRGRTCFLHGDVLKLGMTLNAGDDAGDWRLDGEFRVYPANVFGAQMEVRAHARRSRARRAPASTAEERQLARARAREEHAANKARLASVDGGARAALRFGDGVQFRHVATGCWLQEDPHDGIVNGELVSIMKHVTNDAHTDFHDLYMPRNAELKRMFLQLLFNIATVLLLLNMIAGIILDAFTQETMESQVRREKRDHETFATGLSRSYLESEELSFADHQALFAMINYVHFVGYVRDKDPSIDSPIEAYVRAKIDEGDTTWIPMGTSWALENQRRIKAAEKDDYAKLAKRFDDLADAAETREKALHDKLDELHKAVAALQDASARRHSTVPGA